jgi:hypothetical protein
MPFALSQLGSRVAARCKANDSLTACQFIAEESQPDGLSRVPHVGASVAHDGSCECSDSKTANFG